VCRHFRIEWIFVGDVELKKFDKAALAKFERSNHFRLGFRSKGTAVYQVVY
jgi:hypothetical protein